MVCPSHSTRGSLASLFVMASEASLCVSPLAALELGPSSRNIAGARRSVYPARIEHDVCICIFAVEVRLQILARGDLIGFGICK